MPTLDSKSSDHRAYKLRVLLAAGGSENIGFVLELLGWLPAPMFFVSKLLRMCIYIPSVSPLDTSYCILYTGFDVSDQICLGNGYRE